MSTPDPSSVYLYATNVKGNTEVMSVRLEAGLVNPGAKLCVSGKPSGSPHEMWVFKPSIIPGVFGLTQKSFFGETLFLTIPTGAKSGSEPTMEKMLTGNDYDRQLWRLIPSDDGAKSQIQSFSLSEGNGLCLDNANGNVAERGMLLWARNQGEYQKFYIRIPE